jgi:uncharacterized protein YrrD
MHKVSDLVGRTVVSSETGDRLGRVADVLLEPHSDRALGLVIGGGLFEGEHVLPIGDVQTLGTDAVVARSAQGVLDAKQWRERRIDAARSSALKHRRVLTTGGRMLGEIDDVLLDDTGVVEAFEISRPAFGGLVRQRSRLPQDSQVTIGDDAVLVSDAAADAMERNGRS